MTCPVCAAVIEREDGCNQMLCHCGCEFCYECQEEFDHYGDCPNNCHDNY